MHKIAVFMGEYGDYQIQLSDTVIEEAARCGDIVHIFTNSGSYGSNFFYALGEKMIIKIPNLADYDGIIVAADTFGISGMYEELAELILKDATCPTVCVRKGDARFYSVLVDNYSAMRAMVEHMITVHGYEKICFMTGIMTLKDAWDRRQGYLDVMKEHGLLITEKMMFEGDYWRNKGEEAVEWFLSGEEKPQAIVCANDYMAISVCAALRKRNIRVPEEIAVTGFDDVEEVKCSVPTISSMAVSNKQLAIAAYRILENVWSGRPQKQDVYVEVNESYKESCGCQYQMDTESIKKRFYETESIRKVLYRNVHMNADFENANTFDELAEYARRYIENYPYEAIYVCSCNDEDKKAEAAYMQGKYTEDMVLRAILTPQKTTIMKKEFRRTDILPAEYQKDQVPLYIAPLHARDDCLGYVVLKTKKIEEFKFFFQIWALGLANAIDRQRMYHENCDLMNMRLQYNRDELTGIANRREMDKILRNRHQRLSSHKEGFCVVSIDMDGLKNINDTYGHLEGDEALIKLARILEESKGEKGDVARTGGDEYLMCIGTDNLKEIEAIINGVRKRMDDYNDQKIKPYRLSASIGYVCCKKNMSLLDCMQISDERMYREKRKKKESISG